MKSDWLGSTIFDDENTAWTTRWGNKRNPALLTVNHCLLSYFIWLFFSHWRLHVFFKWTDAQLFTPVRESIPSFQTCHLDLQRGSRHVQPPQVAAAAPPHRRGSRAACAMLSQPSSIWNLHLVRCPVRRTHVCAVALTPTAAKAVKKTKSTVRFAQESQGGRAATSGGFCWKSCARLVNYSNYSRQNYDHK